MTVYKLKVKFPCGFEFEQFIKTGWGIRVPTYEDITECPIHGKKCSKSEEKK